jgi:two-component sensor histidine kinase
MTTVSYQAPEKETFREYSRFLLNNLAAWFCFCATLTVLNYTTHDKSLAREIVSDLILFFACNIGTMLLRRIIRSAGTDAPWRSVYMHAFVFGLPIVSLLMTILMIELNALLISDGSPHSFYKALFGLWFFMFLLFGVWTGVYVSALAVERSNKSEVERLETETALREAELRALKAQINPHFLFNSLNTIRALVNEHPDRAQEAVLHLSLMLRASLQSESMLRPLREEIETTQHYLELEKMRFEERLKVAIEIESAAMEVLMPTMIVQTLVENAVKHGIGASVRGGLLRISGKVENRRLIVTISNPGSLKNKADGTGLGLNNARMRLARMIGDDTRLDLTENEGIVTARLDLPATRDDKGTIG